MPDDHFSRYVPSAEEVTQHQALADALQPAINAALAAGELSTAGDIQAVQAKYSARAEDMRISIERASNSAASETKIRISNLPKNEDMAPAQPIVLRPGLTAEQALASIEKARAALQQAVSDVTLTAHILGEDPEIGNSAFFSGNRWLNMAREDLQTGLMKLERAILLPAKW